MTYLAGAFVLAGIFIATEYGFHVFYKRYHQKRIRMITMREIRKIEDAKGYKF